MLKGGTQLRPRPFRIEQINSGRIFLRCERTADLEMCARFHELDGIRGYTQGGKLVQAGCECLREPSSLWSPFGVQTESKSAGQHWVGWSESPLPMVRQVRSIVYRQWAGWAGFCGQILSEQSCTGRFSPSYTLRILPILPMPPAWHTARPWPETAPVFAPRWPTSRPRARTGSVRPSLRPNPSLESTWSPIGVQTRFAALG